MVAVAGDGIPAQCGGCAAADLDAVLSSNIGGSCTCHGVIRDGGVGAGIVNYDTALLITHDGIVVDGGCAGGGPSLASNPYCDTVLAATEG